MVNAESDGLLYKLFASLTSGLVSSSEQMHEFIDYVRDGEELFVLCSRTFLQVPNG